MLVLMMGIDDDDDDDDRPFYTNYSYACAPLPATMCGPSLLNTGLTAMPPASPFTTNGIAATKVAAQTPKKLT